MKEGKERQTDRQRGGRAIQLQPPSLLFHPAGPRRGEEGSTVLQGAARDSACRGSQGAARLRPEAAWQRSTAPLLTTRSRWGLEAAWPGRLFTCSFVSTTLILN